MAALGRYELVERIGAGGMAEVWRARPDDGGAEVAIKLLARGGAASAEQLGRFERESRVAEGIEHPHLIRVLEHGVDDERGPWLAMPLVRGMTLRDLFGGRRLCPEAALVLLLPLVEALGALHDSGLVHRDVKPENWMLSPLGDATLVDLGLTIGEHHTRHTAENEVAGSVPYLSPERIEGRDVDATADVWAVGVMLYELIVGKRPFERARAGEEVAAILSATFTPLGEADRRVGPELGWLVGVCLAREPWGRPKDAKALLDRMRGLVPVARERLRDERVAVLSDPVGYEQRVAPRVVAAALEEAEAKIEAGDPFEALRVLDRALAYAPDDARVLALVDETGSPSRSREGAGGRAAEGGGGRERAGAGSGSKEPRGRTEAVHSSSRPRPSAALPPPPSRKREGAIFGVLVVAVGVLVWSLWPSDDEDVAPVAITAPVTVPDAGPPDAGTAPLALIPIHLDLLSNADPPDLDGVARAEGEPLVTVDFTSGRDPAVFLREADAALAADPEDVGARVDRAMALLALEREDDGLAALATLERAHPRHPEVQAALGFVRMRQGRFDEADELFSRALAQRPDDTDTRRHRGVLRRRVGRTRDAYRDLAEVLRENPDELHALAELTNVYQRAGRVRDAVPIVRRILHRHPTNAEAWASLSIALTGEGDPTLQDEAVEAIERAIALDADEPRYLRQRCVLFSMLERPGAVPACGEAIQADPNEPDLFMARARELSRMGEHAQALADADRAVELAPEVARLYFNRHLLRGRAGRVQDALRDLMHACQLGHVRSCTQLRDDGVIP